MYRLKSNRALAAALEAEFEKDARNAVILSSVAGILSTIGNPDNKLSVLGITVSLKDQFLLSGALCAVAIYYGASCLMLGLKLYGVGWPSNYELFFKRYLFKRRNKCKDAYSPLRTKRELRAICLVMNFCLVLAGFALVIIYFYGVAATFKDLMKVLTVVFGFPLPFAF